jgi:hypothetical protein
MRSTALILRAVPGVVVIRAASILVVPDGHALSGRHSGHALDREGQGKQRDSKKAEAPKQHCRKLYASRFERNPSRGFRRPAHFLQRRHTSYDPLHR